MLKVLVVEDEELIRKGIVLAVDWAALDCVVVGEASNGEEALDAVERLSPSLIITDLKMPRMDGIEMLRRLREAGNPVYVIILTAYDSFTYAQSALRLGAVDFLLKPFQGFDHMAIRTDRQDGTGQNRLSIHQHHSRKFCPRNHDTSVIFFNNRICHRKTCSHKCFESQRHQHPSDIYNTDHNLRFFPIYFFSLCCDLNICDRSFFYIYL